MAAPSLSKSWIFTDVGSRFYDRSTALLCFQQTMRKIKNLLVGWSWIVRGSSDASTAGMDGTDRWTADDKLVWSAGARSWIVLRKTDAAGTGKHFELLIALSNASPQNVGQVAFSYAGFAGGGISSNPTAADQLNVLSSALWIDQANTQFGCVVHALRSSDNEVQRIVGLKDNTTLFFLDFARAKNPVSAWTHPFIASWTAAMSYATFSDAASYRAYDGNVAAGWMSFYAATVGHVNGALGQRLVRRNDISNEATVTPIFLATETAGKRGHHGEIYDLWFGATNQLYGNTLPDTEAGTYATFGDLIMPWDGSAPLTR